MNKILTIAAFIVLAQVSHAQNLDSLVTASQPEFLPGKIPTYYTPGKKGVAQKLQKLAASVAAYYEKQFGMPFHVKMAVLDSAHWPSQIAPYGIIFSHKDWVFMHAGMSFENFQNVYGMQHFRNETQKTIQQKKMKGDAFVQSFLAFYTVHELGHYFLNSLSGARYPDYFTNEWMASFFAYQYFTDQQPGVLPAFDLFCQLYRDNIKPRFTSIDAFNQHFNDDGGGIPTYGWYQVNFYFLCKDVWKCAGHHLLPNYRMAFPRSASVKLSAEEIVKKFDPCSEVLSNFETKLERKTVAGR